MPSHVCSSSTVTSNSAAASSSHWRLFSSHAAMNTGSLHISSIIWSNSRVMDLETKLLYSQLKRIREAIDTAEQLDYTSYCTVHLWKVFYEYERQLHNHINPPTLHKRRSSWIWRTTVHRLLRPRIIHHFTTWQWGITHRLSDGMERHPPNWQVTGFTMKYAVILKRTKKHNKISTKRLTFFSLDDAAHYERNIKLHDPKVIHTELIPDFSWKQLSTYWTTTLLFIWIRNAKVNFQIMICIYLHHLKELLKLSH